MRKKGVIGALVASIVTEGGVFFRKASGTLSLAYAAAGRLIGYIEYHVHALDHLADQLMLREAGGCVETQDLETVLPHGGRVVAAAPGVFERPVMLTERAIGQHTSSEVKKPNSDASLIQVKGTPAMMRTGRNAMRSASIDSRNGALKRPHQSNSIGMDADL